MEIPEFEKWCSKLRLRPVEKETTPLGDVLLAEGFFNTPQEGPHWRLFWGVARGEAKVGRMVHVPQYQVIRQIRRSVTKRERRAVAVRDAMQFLEDGQMSPHSPKPKAGLNA